jgi:phosphopantothenoylcysteine decarboxylase/phosphopantothenate--cysteine ligase
MNVNMWQHPATRRNADVLRQRGDIIVEPGDGYLACGMLGAGRLAENECIVEAVLAALDARTRSNERGLDLSGEIILITAGPTREPIDPVRFIGNRSSGKMGFALAEAARDRGATVIVVAGPTSAPAPSGVEIIRVERTEEMRQAVLARLGDSTIVIKAAAVADYRPSTEFAQKLKRNGPATLNLEPTPDILAEIAAKRSGQVIVGFAAETENALVNARKKLERKSLDAIVVNDVSQAGIGFDADENAVTILSAAGEEHIPKAPKRAIANHILDSVLALKKSRAVI